MAGSLSHLVGIDGRFTMDLIENLGDAHEALEECFVLIFELAGGDSDRVSAACRKHGFPDPWSEGDDQSAPMRIDNDAKRSSGGVVVK